jgi:hypothetical protein
MLIPSDFRFQEISVTARKTDHHCLFRFQGYRNARLLTGNGIGAKQTENGYNSFQSGDASAL